LINDSILYLTSLEGFVAAENFISDPTNVHIFLIAQNELKKFFRICA